MKTFLKRILEYIIIIIICALVSSIVFAYEFKQYNTYIDEQMLLSNLLVEAVQILAAKIDHMENMRGI